jgi:signal transduction histidine kinase
LKLTFKLPAIVVGAILLTTIVSGAVSIVIGRQAIRQTTLDHMLHNAGTYAGAVLSHIDGARAVLATVAALPQFGSPARAREAAALVLAQSDTFEYVMLLTPEGATTMVEPRSLEVLLSHRDLSFSAWFGELRRANRSIVSDLHISPVTQRPSIVIATPVHSAEGRTLGIWVGALKLEQLSKIGALAADPIQQIEAGYLTDRRGLVIAHQNRPAFVESQTDFSSVYSVKEALAGRSGASEFFNAIEDEQKIAGYVPLPNLGWAAVFRIPAAVALEPAAALTRSVILASVVLAMLIGLGVYVLARQTVAPVTQLIAAAQIVGKGDFSRRIEASSVDEIGLLADEFNRMVDALAEMDAHVREKTLALARSNAELEQFAYVASHDLQEPLRMVVGYVQLLEKRLAGKLDADTLEFMAFAVDGALRMQNLIQDILAYSRVGTKGRSLVPVDSAEALNEALALLAGRVAETGAGVTAQPLPRVMADRTQLVQLFQNLIGNAFKFCKDDAPRVRVEAAHEAGWWRFSITDNGIGIAPEYRAQLFVVFKRLHTRREYPGTGIGLAICKRIIERHGGEIGIESAPGGGAVFWFTLPEEKLP